MFSAKSRFKSIVAAVALLLTVAPVLAGQYVLIKKDDPRENYQFSDVDGVCAAYEENLKRFEHLPHGMACERQLDPKLGFSRPTWQKLDPMKYPDLVQDIFRLRNWVEHGMPNDKRPWIDRLKERVEKNHLTVEITQADVNRDGAPDNIIRVWSDTPGRACEPKSRLEGWMGHGGNNKTIMVADPSMAKIADYFIDIVDRIHGPSVEYDNVFLYKGKVYFDTFYGNIPALRAIEGRDATLYINSFFERGVGRSCKFHYHESNSANK